MPAFRPRQAAYFTNWCTVLLNDRTMHCCAEILPGSVQKWDLGYKTVKIWNFLTILPCSPPILIKFSYYMLVAELRLATEFCHFCAPDDVQSAPSVSSFRRQLKDILVPPVISYHFSLHFCNYVFMHFATVLATLNILDWHWHSETMNIILLGVFSQIFWFPQQLNNWWKSG